MRLTYVRVVPNENAWSYYLACPIRLHGVVRILSTFVATFCHLS